MAFRGSATRSRPCSPLAGVAPVAAFAVAALGRQSVSAPPTANQATQQVGAGGGQARAPALPAGWSQDGPQLLVLIRGDDAQPVGGDGLAFDIAQPGGLGTEQQVPDLLGCERLTLVVVRPCLFQAMAIAVWDRPAMTSLAAASSAWASVGLSTSRYLTRPEARSGYGSRS